jgi:hypothetical protein
MTWPPRPCTQASFVCKAWGRCTQATRCNPDAYPIGEVLAHTLLQAGVELGCGELVLPCAHSKRWAHVGGRVIPQEASYAPLSPVTLSPLAR